MRTVYILYIIRKNIRDKNIRLIRVLEITKRSKTIEYDRDRVFEIILWMDGEEGQV